MIVFSGHFDTKKNPERVNFLEKMLSYDIEKKLKFTIFNQSGSCEASFNVISILNEHDHNFSKSALKKFLKQHLILDSQYPNFIASKKLINRTVEEIILESKNILSPSAAITIQLRKLMPFVKMLDDQKPDMLVLWNQFNVFHRIVAKIAKNRNIPLAYFHDGVLPGSVTFDFDGEMGESWVSRVPEKLLEVKVSKSQRGKAEKFLDIIKQNALNRHEQLPAIDFKDVLKVKQVKNKLVILLCGQNDWHAGIQPENPKRIFHSPHFSSSFDLFEELDKIAGANGYHILYKPHPNDKDRYCYLRGDDYPNSTIISHAKIEDMIDYAAVTVTIASQVCYTVAIKSKPCVLAGINQMHGKGISFDLENRNQLADIIKTAINLHNPENQKAALIKHMAQLNQAYLYDYETIETDFYERTALDAMDALKTHIDDLKVA